MKMTHPATQRLLLSSCVDERELPTRRLPAVEVEALASRARRLRALQSSPSSMQAIVHSPIDAHGSPFWAAPMKRITLPPPVIEAEEVWAPESVATPPKEHAWWEAIVMSAVASTGAALVHFVGMWVRAGGALHVAQAWRLPVLTGTAVLALQMCILAVIAFKRSVRDESQSHSGASWLWVAGVAATAPLSGIALACGADRMMFAPSGAPHGAAIAGLALASVVAAELMVRVISFKRGSHQNFPRFENRGTD